MDREIKELKNKPNVVIFMMDQLSAKWLEAGERGVIPTPNFDRLKKMGTTFTRAISSNPICMPARATMATGLTSRGHGVTENGCELDPQIPTFMQILQRNGWHTGNFGKLHYRTHYNGPYHDYKVYGFDVTHDIQDIMAGEWLDWIEENHPQHYEAALSTIKAWDVPGMRSYGKHGINLLERIDHATQKVRKEHPVFNDKLIKEVYVPPLPDELTHTEWITMHALDFIENADAETPILAHISYLHPHNPFTPPKEYLSLVNLDMIPEPVPNTWLNDPGHPKHFDFFASRGMERDIPDYWRIVRQYYFACIVHLDRQLGKILDALTSTGKLEETYVMLVADHGELLYDHGFTAKCNRHYDACIRVPLIIAGPGLNQNQTVDKFVQLEDIMPTIMELTGCKPPAPKILRENMVREEIPLYSGRSLVPLCKGEIVNDWRDDAYVEGYSYWGNVQPYHWARTVRTEQFRYTYYPSGGGEQLFDLYNDPDEMKNVAADPAYSTMKSDLRDRLLEYVIMQDSPKKPTGRLFYHEHP